MNLISTNIPRSTRAVAEALSQRMGWKLQVAFQVMGQLAIDTPDEKLLDAFRRANDVDDDDKPNTQPNGNTPAPGTPGAPSPVESDNASPEHGDGAGPAGFSSSQHVDVSA